MTIRFCKRTDGNVPETPSPRVHPVDALTPHVL